MDRDQLVKAYYSLKNSPEGQIVLDDLQNLFTKTQLYSDHESESKMMAKVGAHDVVIYILSMIEEYELQLKGRG